jgi:hypothetical protein
MSGKLVVPSLPVLKSTFVTTEWAVKNLYTLNTLWKATTRYTLWRVAEQYNIIPHLQRNKKTGNQLNDHYTDNHYAIFEAPLNDRSLPPPVRSHPELTEPRQHSPQRHSALQDSLETTQTVLQDPNRVPCSLQCRTKNFFSGGGFNKFSWQRAERTGIWGR